MASLAVLLKKRGYKITGSDQNVYPPMSDFLAANHIEIDSPYNVKNLKPHPDFVVLGNALSRGNPEVEYALESHLHYLSMAELLKNEFIRGSRSIVITGTHGKTSTTSLAAHVFDRCGKSPGFMVGGIPENFGTSARDVEQGGYFIVEGDEYDTSFFDKRSKFFHYLPDLLVINNIEFDHADIFKDLDEIKRSFILMLRQVPKNGLIVVNGDDPVAREVAGQGFSPICTFGLDESCDVIISQIQALDGNKGMSFLLEHEGEKRKWTIPLIGSFNVMNAVAVIILAKHEKLDESALQDALNSYKNVKRRMEELTSNNSIRVIEDFAHHPTAIKGTLDAVRMAWPDARIHAVFEARSNTSKSYHHQDKMAEAFRSADTVTFSQLHREELIRPEEKLDVGKIINELTRSDKFAHQPANNDEIVEYWRKEAISNDIFVFMSNGSFDGIQHRLAKEFDKRC